MTTVDKAFWATICLLVCVAVYLRIWAILQVRKIKTARDAAREILNGLRDGSVVLRKGPPLPRFRERCRVTESIWHGGTYRASAYWFRKRERLPK